MAENGNNGGPTDPPPEKPPGITKAQYKRFVQQATTIRDLANSAIDNVRDLRDLAGDILIDLRDLADTYGWKEDDD